MEDKNVLFISNGVYETDGRLRELLKIAKGIGQLTAIVRGKEEKDEKNFHIITQNSFKTFVKKSYKIAKGMKNIDILFIDNRKACVSGLLIERFLKPKKIIYDARELYFLEETKHMAGKLGCIIEKSMIKKSDILICANEQRADIMQKYYKLKKRPLVFENIRALKSVCDEKNKEYEQKYKDIFKKDIFNIIITTGVDLERRTDEILKIKNKLPKNTQIILVGGGPEKDGEKIKEIIKEQNLEGVKILGRVNQDELKFLINKSDIGIVSYHKKNQNNRYCASGKIYEFIFEHTPVVCTTNETLVDCVNKYKVGVCDENFYQAIMKVYENYDYYKENTIKASKDIDVSKNNEKLINEIKERL